MSTTVDPETQDHDVAAAAIASGASAEPAACASCGAPTAPGQLMCLDCGARLALDYRRAPSWRLPAAIAAVVVLIAGAGLAFALAQVTNDAEKTTANAPTQPVSSAAPGDQPPATASQTTAAPTPSTPTPAPAGTSTSPAPAATGTTTSPAPPAAAAPSAGWPAGRSAFTVILASMPNKADADAKLKQAQSAGIASAAILHSDDFPSLRPGYWVVFDGQFETMEQAQAQAQQDRGKGFGDAYPRYVSKTKSQSPSGQ